MLIRHAEKPAPGVDGVAPNGSIDAGSLTTRGWQRVGALVRFFCPLVAVPGSLVTTPETVFAAGVGPTSKSKRSIQTVSALAELLQTNASFSLITNYLKDDIQAMVADASVRHGVVLIAWEHKLNASIVKSITSGAIEPQEWPDTCFDMVWVLDCACGAWTFKRVPQRLLPGDEA
jgi:hypothetical protein